MRDQPYHPIAGLAVVFIVGIGFWSGVVLLAEKVFSSSVPTQSSVVPERAGLN